MAGNSSVLTHSIIERAGHVFPNPFFDIASQFVPRDIKSTFQWAEYLYMRNGTYRSAVDRIVRYPITALKIVSENKGEETKEKYEDLFNKILDFRTLLARIGENQLVYGNAFVSMYMPFDRFLLCPECGLERRIENVDFKFQNFEFSVSCECGYTGTHTRKDRVSRQQKRINIVLWDPKQIDINFERFSGNLEYYWNPDPDTIHKVMKGDPLTIRSLPWSVISTIKDKGVLKFEKDAIFHIKENSLAGYAIEWGIPNCIPIFATHYYTALLRRANEAIFMDYILPWRVIHPQTAKGQSDPTMFLPLGTFVNRMQSMIRRRRKDPLDVQISPVPVGYQTISGEGKSLLVSDEMRMMDEQLLNGLGFPAELFYGTLTIQAMPAALRLFENNWSYLISGYNRLLQWIADRASDYFHWEEIEVSLERVTIADDIEKKQVMLQFAAAQAVSQSTALGTYGLDYKAELERKIEDARLSMQVQQDAQDLALAEQEMGMGPAGPTGGGGGAAGTSVFDIDAQAMEIAQQLLAMPFEMRRKQMLDIARSNNTLYALVKQKMEEIRNTSKTQMGQQALAQAGMGGAVMPPGGMPM